ncbi:MAG: acetyltransferase [Candidatus Krumholzibacteriota bacterium]|nr:acetyltransferase [Candidatus Krumholzibacteriota bacterium]
MKDIVIVGGGGHAKVVISILKKSGGFNIAGYVDPEGRGDLLGIPYLGDDSSLGGLIGSSRATEAAIGLGQIGGSEKRRELVSLLIDLGYSFPPIISPDAVINEQVDIGGGTVVMDGAVINTCTSIGRFSIINTRASVDHDCQIGDFVHIAPGVTVNGGVRIGDDTLIGAGSTVLQYLKIGRACMIGMNSMIANDCEDFSKWLSRPARKIK